MLQRFLRKSCQRLFTVLFSFSVVSVSAQPTGLLYDPEPPAESAYVRVIQAAREGVIDVWIDGRSRIQKLGPGEASEYMVLAAGKHTIALHLTDKQSAQLTTTLEVVRGRATTIAFTSMKPDSTPIIFEDKVNSNKLKALLTAYHLTDKTASLDVLTLDGKTKVFSSVAYGASASIQVNPISIDLIAAKVGEKIPQASTSLTMSQGGTYSVLLLPGEGGKLVARSVQNKIERYTGK